MKVYLHTGAGKTGTSAIQAALAMLRPSLAAAGILYPAGFNDSDEGAARGEVSQGNGAAMGGLVNANKRHARYDMPAVMGWLNGCIAEAAGRDLLFSSEAMQFARAAEMTELCNFFASAGYEVTVIHYVRHALDQAVATFLQHLKRGQIGNGPREKLRDRKTFFERERTAYLVSLEQFAQVLPAERIIVRLYDTERTDLIPGFLRLLREKPFDVPLPVGVINRSPTAAEQVVFQELSRLPDGPRLCRLVDRLTLNRPPGGPAVTSVTEQEFAAFASRNQPIVDAVNKHFLKGHGELLIKSDRIQVGDTVPPSPEEVYAAFANSFALLEADIRAKLRAERRAAAAKIRRPA
ncbi:hypothetical protein [Caenimonas aquaedulcis]|uniref:Sulfotransferase family protein n=1 Tax=Caenimonas aquaedulcis TaxID=2793270 RepID=A0A931H441_9BURK|nr:hypothetical protein [Caenimonas aquaedulcis]MBG9388183.1 hypothetical protein [Caenimonas aquaedulcis]